MAVTVSCFCCFVFVVVFSLSTTLVIRLHVALFPAMHTDNVSRNSIVRSDQVHQSTFNQVTVVYWLCVEAYLYAHLFS